MAIIFVWFPQHGNVGHASMKLDTGGYISWWPSDGVALKNSGTKDAVARGISGDKRAEGGNPHYASPPLEDLDEKSMEAHWRQLSGRLPKEDHTTAQTPRPIAGGGYDLFARSCAGIVLDTSLREGCIGSTP